jgi:hypothetical protein
MSTDNEVPPPASRIPGPVVIGVCAVIALLIIALVAPAILQAREAARRMQSRNLLKQLGMGLQNYHDTHNVFPPGGVFNEDGIAFHEWTTFLRPYLDAFPWFSMIDWNRPWDDVQNADCFRSHRRMYLFVNPSVPLVDRSDGLCVNHYAASQSVLFRNSSVSISDLESGTSRRLLVADAFDHFLPIGCPYGWRDATLGFANDPNGFGCRTRDFTQCLMADGSVLEISAKADEQIAVEMAGPKESQPSAQEVERITEYPPLDVSKIWKVEFIPDVDENGDLRKCGVVRRTSPDGKTVLTR